MVCSGYRGSIEVDARWKRRAAMKILGQYLDDDGGIKTCYDSTLAAMWRCFYGNLSPGLTGFYEKTKLRFLSSPVVTIASFRWASWPYHNFFAAGIDSAQRHMISILMNWKPSRNESFTDFAKRRNIRAGWLASEHGRWSYRWAHRERSWHAHVQRAHDAGTWSYARMNHHGAVWLQTQRDVASGPRGEPRTNTRAYRGKVQRRWHEGAQRVADA